MEYIPNMADSSLTAIGEKVILGSIVHGNHMLLGQVNDEYFEYEDTKELYKFLRDEGTYPKYPLMKFLRDRKKNHLVDLVEHVCETAEDCGAVGEHGEPQIRAWISTIEASRITKKLVKISNSISEGILAGKKPDDIIVKTEQELSSIYASSIQLLGATKENVKNFYSSSKDKSIKHLYSKPVIGIPTGINILDNTVGGIVRGGIVSVAGVSGNMKTTSTLALVRSMLKCNPDLTARFYQIEMTGRDMVLQILGQNGINRTEITRQQIPQHELEEVLRNDPIADRFTWFTDEGDKMGSFKEIRVDVLKHKPDVWVIDYMGQLVMNESQRHQRDNTKHNLYFSETMHKIKKLCQDTDTICFLLHQASLKTGRDKHNPKPRLEDIEYSQDIYRLSNYVYFCYYPCKYPEIVFHSIAAGRLFYQLWQKIRYGNNVEIMLEVDPATGIFTDELSPEVESIGNAHSRRFSNITKANGSIV